MSISIAPKPAPQLGPTPIQIPVLQAYVLGDFMRAFGIDEQTIQFVQQGFAAGDFNGLIIRGLNTSGMIVERTTLHFYEIVREATLMVDTGSEVSITEQLSRNLANSILYSAATMRRKGLHVRYSYVLTAKASANTEATFQRYGLTFDVPDTVTPGSSMRQVYAISHRPTGATISHDTAWRTG